MNGAVDDTAWGARWLDRLAGLALLTSVGTVAGAATPALLRVAGVGAAPEGYAELPRPRAPSPKVTAAPTSTHRFEFLYDDDGDKPPPTMTAPGQSDSSWATPRKGVVRKPLDLRDQAGAGGAIIGELKPGAIVAIVKEQGEWVLVAQTGTDDMAFGWAPRSGVAVR